MADVKLEDGIIRIKELDIQDVRQLKSWPNTLKHDGLKSPAVRLKIGLGYLQGGAQD